MKYISLTYQEDGQTINIATLKADYDVLDRFKQSIIDHFDAEVSSVEFALNDVDSLLDCLNACQIDVWVGIVDGNEEEAIWAITAQETWLY